MSMTETLHFLYRSDFANVLNRSNEAAEHRHLYGHHRCHAPSIVYIHCAQVQVLAM